MFQTGSRSRASSISKEKSFTAHKTTSEDQDKRYKFMKKLTSNSADQFRQIDINEYDLNFTQHFEELQYIDDTVTPLIYCAHYGLKQICRFLLKNKTIDIDQQTETNKQTALIVACINGNYEIIRHLLLAGAEVNKPNSLNHNALTAILFRLVQENFSFQNKKICLLIAQLLIKNGADPNWIVDKTKGYSLVHYFCSSKMKMNKTQKMINEDIINFLLNHGANPLQKTLKDQDAFDLVNPHCNKERILQLLNEWKQKHENKQKLKNSQLLPKKRKTIAEQFMRIQIKPRNSNDSIKIKELGLTQTTKQSNFTDYTKQETSSIIRNQQRQQRMQRKNRKNKQVEKEDLNQIVIDDIEYKIQKN